MAKYIPKSERIYAVMLNGKELARHYARDSKSAKNKVISKLTTKRLK